MSTWSLKALFAGPKRLPCQRHSSLAGAVPCELATYQTVQVVDSNRNRQKEGVTSRASNWQSSAKSACQIGAKVSSWHEKLETRTMDHPLLLKYARRESLERPMDHARMGAAWTTSPDGSAVTSPATKRGAVICQRMRREGVGSRRFNHTCHRDRSAWQSARLQRRASWQRTIARGRDLWQCGCIRTHAAGCSERADGRQSRRIRQQSPCLSWHQNTT